MFSKYREPLIVTVCWNDLKNLFLTQLTLAPYCLKIRYYFVRTTGAEALVLSK